MCVPVCVCVGGVEWWRRWAAHSILYLCACYECVCMLACVCMCFTDPVNLVRTGGVRCTHHWLACYTLCVCVCAWRGGDVAECEPHTPLSACVCADKCACAGICACVIMPVCLSFKYTTACLFVYVRGRGMGVKSGVSHLSLSLYIRHK